MASKEMPALGGSCADLIEAVFQEAVAGRGWPALLHELRMRLSAGQIGWICHDSLARAGRVEESIGIPEEARASYAARFAGLNIWFERLVRVPVGAAVFGTDLVPSWELVRSDLYKEWLRPMDAQHALIGIVEKAGSELHGLLVLRSGRQPDFSATHRAALAAFLPHLRWASLVARVRAREENRHRVLAEVLDMAPEAVLVVDRSCCVQVHNVAAERLLQREGGLSIRGGRLVACRPEDATRLAGQVSATIRSCLQAAPKAEPVLIGTASGHPILVTITPLSASLVRDGERPVPLAAIVVRDPARQTHLSRDQLRRVFALTPAEARLADLLLAGNTLVKAAAALRISKNTARTHMKRIYAKTETHRQSELGRLLAASLFQRGEDAGPEPGRGYEAASRIAPHPKG